MRWRCGVIGPMMYMDVRSTVGTGASNALPTSCMVLVAPTMPLLWSLPPRVCRGSTATQVRAAQLDDGLGDDRRRNEQIWLEAQDFLEVQRRVVDDDRQFGSGWGIGAVAADADDLRAKTQSEEDLGDIG